MIADCRKCPYKHDAVDDCPETAEKALAYQAVLLAETWLGRRQYDGGSVSRIVDAIDQTLGQDLEEKRNAIHRKWCADAPGHDETCKSATKRLRAWEDAHPEVRS